MLTFYPGPSKIYPQLETYLQDAFHSGILQMNHRSQPFMDLLRETIHLLHEKLNIPPNYSIYFTSSATECWEIIAQSLVENKSLHIYNGAFGKKWHEYSSKICNKTEKYEFSTENKLNFKSTTDADIICITQNETSNGTQINLSLNPYPIERDFIIAVDATSSMAGIELDWKLADVWLASVQKCFGLPAGTGIMICSPKALKQAQKLNKKQHYNNLLFIDENFNKYQTPYTPNILGIYLLNRVMNQVADIEEVSYKTKTRANDFYEFIEQKTSWELLVKNPEVRSDTVISVMGSEEKIKTIKLRAKEQGIILGNGYGEGAKTTFRIANFPAIEDWEFEKLKNFLVTHHLKS